MGGAATAASTTAVSATVLMSAVKRATDIVFLAALFTVTFTKLQWESAGGVVLPDMLTALLVAAVALERLLRRDERIPPTAIRILLIGVSLLALYSTGFMSAIDVDGGTQQVAKGLMRLGLHFALLAAGVTYLAWRPRRFLFRGVACLAAGVAANASYALAQAVAHEADRNLDAIVISPLTGHRARSLVYGLDRSPDVPRLTGLTADPDHLAIMLILPILLLLPLYLQLPLRDRRRWPIALLISTLLLVAVGTLSRSGLLGLAAGSVLVCWRYPRRFWSRRVLVPLAAVALVLLMLTATNPARSARVVIARVRIDHVAMSHLNQYEFVPRALATNAAFGIGLENFGRRYAPITGRENFGPHSFYLQSLTETGIVGTFAFGLFLAYVALRLWAAGRAATSSFDDALIVGLGAVLVGTMTANIFYLTMTFYYFYAFLILVFAIDQRHAGGRFAATDGRRVARSPTDPSSLGSSGVLRVQPHP